jgi:hypothetical protein
LAKLITTAKRIRDIAQVAASSGSKIRWFDFAQFRKGQPPRGGVPVFLEPINSVEVVSIAPRRSLSYLARLTPVNEESLVFLAPPDLFRLGVLFCADSPFSMAFGYGSSFLSLPEPQWPIIATAPHHGAETNRAAYGHILAWTKVLT